LEKGEEGRFAESRASQERCSTTWARKNSIQIAENCYETRCTATTTGFTLAIHPSGRRLIEEG